MDPLRVGIAGLGTVGSGTLRVLTSQADLLAARAGRRIEVTGVCARDADKKRSVDINGLRWFDDPLAMVADDNIDLIVETIGGSDGIARTLVEKALTSGKPVVTANKALIAHHGFTLASLAEQNNAVIAFEAAVAGGIPIIKVLRDGLSANHITSIVGILNATCNVILTNMADRQEDLAEVITAAGRMGLLEADPSLDIDGHDAAHKLAILSALAFGAKPEIDTVYREGIRRITLRDMRYAARLGYGIKLLALATATDKGMMQRVHPCMVPIPSSMAQVHGALNAIMLKGDFVGDLWLQGLGGGEGPTASSVVADIIDVARGAVYKPFILPTSALKNLPTLMFENSQRSYYLRVVVEDKVGVLAEVTDLLRTEQISVRTFLQEAHPTSQWAELVITTHTTYESAMQKALLALERLVSVKEKPYMIRIENF